MKKRTKLITAAVSLGALMTVGGTLAWFTDSETATNTVTTGYVDVKIEEHKPTEEEAQRGGYTFEVDENNTGITYGSLTPGASIPKDPTVIYTGSVDGYVRYKVEIDMGDEAGGDTGFSRELIDKLEFKKDGQKVELNTLVDESNDGLWIYDTNVRSNGDKGTLLFDTVSISKEAGNEIANKSLKIVVKADAIQAANLEDKNNDGIDAEDLKAAFGDGEVAVYNDDEEVVK
ncbi:MAG: SipW-dependent-type signal peptide-containing protein [Clostridium sp.]|mgnify:CR=1 FL=1|nr:SipW-dependent-type signal peptide-containing protein [Clostridium sp.]